MNPRWALRVAPHLVKFEYHDPLWDPERGQVTAREVITLFGLTLGSERRVDYGRVAPVEARKIFVTDALAADGLTAPAARDREPAFLVHNRALRAQVLDWEARLRSVIFSSASPASRRSTTRGCRPTCATGRACSRGAQRARTIARSR